ncbi:cation:proton antiporter [Actinokineospora enzanensis]|uniref:cation:proton antiporter domain-containing protein n=1 Tax=Actinokineospora enzanensis TaxID=155975 RepID=UPI0003800DD1|nr:cation:proton antiporter [Actinokineospora enzanensis]
MGTSRLPLIALAVTLVAWAVAALAGWQAHTAPAYHLAITALLAVGLYGSTRGIELSELRENLRTVVLAITVGVLAKTALISAVMYLIHPRPISLVLGVAVAQIDPLSVGATLSRRMSDSARAILSAWAAFDDPVTVLLTVYLSAFALGGEASDGIADFWQGLAFNGAFVLVAAGLWWLARLLSKHITGVVRVVGAVVAVLLVAGFAVVSVRYGLMLGVAACGLFFRPFRTLDWVVDRTLAAALLLAGAALGVVLGGTVTTHSWPDLLRGLALGGAAFAAQMVMGVALSRHLPRYDRWCLALGQQNGLTAIVLALLLEPDFPGAVAVIAPAVLVTNLLFALGRRVLDRVPGGSSGEVAAVAAHMTATIAVPIPEPTADPTAEPEPPRQTGAVHKPWSAAPGSG